MSPYSTARRIAGWAVITAVATTLLVLGGLALIDRYVQAPRSDRIERAATQSEANGRALTAQAARSCEFFIATADALATLADSPDLTGGSSPPSSACRPSPAPANRRRHHDHP